MKALSVKQPFAELIATGEKKIEYRSWQVAHRGPLLIVASKSPNLERCEEMSMDPAKLAHGVAICVVDLVKVTGDDGDFEWHLKNPRRVEPAPLRGYAALYNVDDALIRYVTATPAAPRTKRPRRARRATLVL